MSDDGMFCPYKKSKKREVSYSWISRTEITTERFGWCSEKKCMAYNNGRCKMLEEERRQAAPPQSIFCCFKGARSWRTII